MPVQCIDTSLGARCHMFCVGPVNSIWFRDHTSNAAPDVACWLIDREWRDLSETHKYSEEREKTRFIHTVFNQWNHCGDKKSSCCENLLTWQVILFIYLFFNVSEPPCSPHTKTHSQLTCMSTLAFRPLNFCKALIVMFHILIFYIFEPKMKNIKDPYHLCNVICQCFVKQYQITHMNVTVMIWFKPTRFICLCDTWNNVSWFLRGLKDLTNYWMSLLYIFV